MSSLWVSAEVLEGENVRKKKAIFECKMEDTISDLYTQCVENEVKEDLPTTKLTVKMYSSKDPLNKYNIPLNAPVSIMKDFSANSVTFSFEKTPTLQASMSGKNAFSYLMTKAKQVDLPKPKVEKDATDKIYNDILELFRNCCYSRNIA